MARSVKSKGLEEVGQLRRRVNRQHSLGRIQKEDRDNLIEKLDDVEAYIISMYEKEERDGGMVW